MYQFGVRRISCGPSAGSSNLISPRQSVFGGGSSGDLAPPIQTLGSSAQIGQPVLPLRIRSTTFFCCGSGFADCAYAGAQASEYAIASKQIGSVPLLAFDLAATDSLFLYQIESALQFQLQLYALRQLHFVAAPRFDEIRGERGERRAFGGFFFVFVFHAFERAHGGSRGGGLRGVFL